MVIHDLILNTTQLGNRAVLRMWFTVKCFISNSGCVLDRTDRSTRGQLTGLTMWLEPIHPFDFPFSTMGTTWFWSVKSLVKGNSGFRLTSHEPGSLGIWKPGRKGLLNLSTWSFFSYFKNLPWVQTWHLTCLLGGFGVLGSKASE